MSVRVTRTVKCQRLKKTTTMKKMKALHLQLEEGVSAQVGRKEEEQAAALEEAQRVALVSVDVGAQELDPGVCQIQ